ncbi:branched-chain amino acid ABC transporter permease [Catellatospora sp. KI3]|uniref:branched-chain amino acid ABC transporter permease n=1 Tax=Catellatospora sp. KI3 TaxID=3041620 RepID=UPI002482F617|nr:branched-chain amino acid ABC transporter permease [Catellatospora sp. KI3]MDI1465417.1 branched-chain amino acid ABC transporter permease [Catellatospora sp. KI3]
MSGNGNGVTKTNGTAQRRGFSARLRALPAWQRWLAILALVTFFYAIPLGWFADPPGFYNPLVTQSSDFSTVLFDSAVYVLLAVGLNVVVGFAGLLDLGYFGFFAVGAYTMALLTSPASKLITEYHWLDSPLPWLLVLPLAVLVTLCTGVLLGWPTLRLRGDYLAIVTLGFAEMIRVIAMQSEWVTNGDRGISGIPHPPGEIDGEPIFGFVDPKPYYWLVLTVIVIVVLGVRNLQNSRVGRAWVAIREDEDAAELMGVPTFKFKMWAFAIGASIGGLSGALWASKVNFMNSTTFGLENSILVLAAVILGGAGSIPGSILGGFLVWYVPEWIRGLGDLVGVEINTTEYRYLVFGLVLIVMMIFRPQGIWPNRAREAEFKDRQKEVAVGE